MATGPVHSRTADADLFLPADGLRLLGQDEGGGYAGRPFLVGRGDGRVIPLPLLPYLIIAAIAEGGVDGGWSAEQVGSRVGTASGQGLTADTVRHLIAGKLAPLGLIAARGADHRDGAPGAEQPSRMKAPPGLKTGGTPLPRRASGPAPSWPTAAGVERLLLPHRRRRWGLALGAAAVLVCVAATAPIMADTGNRETGRTGSSSASASASSSARASASASASAAAASRLQAAAWVTQQVSPDVAVSCDPGMCRQLQRDGFPAARLRQLPRTARGLLGPGLVVATAAVRSQFGPSLAAAYASQVIASFGSGAARVDVRAIAPAGAAAFRIQLAAEQTALASAGRQLLGNKNVQASPSARAALSAGRVDARLLTILALLSAQLPVRLTSFTGAPGAGSGVPLRAAQIDVTSPTARSAVVALLDAQQGPYRPAAVTVVDSGSRAIVALRFDAPAVLNISQP
jgi:hypothetical protein